MCGPEGAGPRFPRPFLRTRRPVLAQGEAQRLRWWRFRPGRCRGRADTAWRASWGDLQPEACDV